MLKIRQEHLDPFRKDPRPFLERLCERLREDYPEDLDGATDGELRARVEGAVACARAQGLTWEVSTYVFVSLSLTIGPNFHRHAMIRPLLHPEGRSPDQAYEELPARLSPEILGSAAKHARNIPFDQL